jgi:lipopolysaccharide transport system ATP-binding protein
VTDLALSARGLGKKYRIRHASTQRYLSLREELSAKTRSMVRKVLHPFSASTGTDSSNEEFWALREVGFEVRQGERLAIIGRNGAGKSTLLKVLSRVTEPTTGEVRIRGRVATLLEVGTGFHPELSGRENIFLNGAILGMSKAEIRKKFDEIVAFAEVEQFLDTPVKRYSSGMYVRLAFSVAAHLEPEILIIDEVLAVGDAQFQQKCLGKMRSVGQGGTTLLFVSHNMQAVQALCNRALMLRAGRVELDASPAEVTEAYLRDGGGDNTGPLLTETITALPADPAFRLERVVLRQKGRVVGDLIETGRSLEIVIEYEVRQRVTGLRVYLDFCDDVDQVLFRTFHDDDADAVPTTAPGRYRSTVVVPADTFGPISYVLRVHAGIYNVRSCTPPGGVSIRLRAELTGRWNRAYPGDTFRGRLALALPWTTEEASS